MKKSTVITVFLLVMLFSLSAAAAQVDLVDGSSLRGEIVNDSIKFRTSYAEFNLQSQYLISITREEENFRLKALENNIFSGQLLDNIRLSTAASELEFSPAEIEKISFSDNSNYQDNKEVSITTSNGDFFFANLVEEHLNIKTSLGSSLAVNLDNILEISYLEEEDLFLIKRENAPEIKADFAQEKLIVWPAAAEIIEFDLNYLKKIVF